jgi:hypothetical protein
MLGIVLVAVALTVGVVAVRTVGFGSEAESDNSLGDVSVVRESSTTKEGATTVITTTDESAPAPTEHAGESTTPDKMPAGESATTVIAGTGESATTGGSTVQDDQASPSGAFAHPVTVSGRKLLDQNGDPYMINTFAAWALAQNGSDADISVALEAVAAAGFNSVTVWPNGGDYSESDSQWTRYENAAGQRFFTGDPLASPFGPAWSSMDRVMQEASRLHLTVLFSIYTGFFDVQGIGQDLIAAGTTNAYNYGREIATRYASYPNIVWHYGADSGVGYGQPLSLVVDAVFHGIRDAEGGKHRLTLAETTQGATSYGQFISQEASPARDGYEWLRVDVNSIYSYEFTTVERFDEVYNEDGATDLPVWDCEMPYRGAGWTTPPTPQEVRERVYSTFIRGGVGLNYGDAWFWPFGKKGLGSGTPPNDWKAAMRLPETADAGRASQFVREHMADTSWVPSDFVTTGLGSGDTKAAAGNSDSAAIAYFPTSRSVVVDTTVLSGSSAVRLRWYDPTTGSYTTIAESEAEDANRSVSYPDERDDGSSDWVLVIDR